MGVFDLSGWFVCKEEEGLIKVKGTNVDDAGTVDEDGVVDDDDDDEEENVLDENGVKEVGTGKAGFVAVGEIDF
jgi:hypothetical protein